MCWGTDGANVFQCFTTPTATLAKKLQSKLWGGRYGFVTLKQALRFYSEMQALNNTSLAITLTLDSDSGSVTETINLGGLITFINNSGGALQFQNNSFQNLFFQTQATIAVNNVDGSGYILGYTVTSMSPDFVIERTALGYKDLTALY